MGGGGSYYDRDVPDKAYRGANGVSSVAERELSRRTADPSLLPKGRKLVCTAKNPLVYLFDVTGSMGNLPKIIYDKWPGIVGQILARKYLADPQMSLAAVGDIRSDQAPLQMADFSALRNLDRHFKNIFFEGQGGGQASESYEVAAYFYVRFCELPKAENPICLFTGDEGFVEQLYADDLREHFGGTHQNISATKVFADLLKKFKGNVFLVHRYYPSNDSDIVRQWQRVLGENRIILLPRGEEGDLAIGDITLGIYAIVSGARTLKQYLEDMRTRPLDLGEGVAYKQQSAERMRQIEGALQPLKDFGPIKVSSSEPDDNPETSAKEGNKKKGKKNWKV